MATTAMSDPNPVPSDETSTTRNTWTRILGLVALGSILAASKTARPRRVIHTAQHHTARHNEVAA